MLPLLPRRPSKYLDINNKLKGYERNVFLLGKLEYLERSWALEFLSHLSKCLKIWMGSALVFIFLVFSLFFSFSFRFLVMA